MARFFFNVFDGHSATDSDGTELPDGEHARREAIRMAGLILLNEGERQPSRDGWMMEVSDESGLVLFQLGVSLVETPVIPTPERVRSHSSRR